jgi:hypothetical protein
VSEFKVGDIVTCIKEDYLDNYVGSLGNKYEVLGVGRQGLYLRPLSKELRKLRNDGVSPLRFKLVEKEDKVKYEDKWNLNDGSVEIPDDAEKLMNPEGTSVVAFRYVKKPKVMIHVRYVIQELNHSNEPYYTTSNGKSSNAVAKLTFIATNGELTDIQWERV